MNYEYILSGHAFAVRDQYMAENVAWIMEYEKKYYQNDYAVLVGSTGHIVIGCLRSLLA